jgi:hypothetical protein
MVRYATWGELCVVSGGRCAIARLFPLLPSGVSVNRGFVTRRFSRPTSTRRFSDGEKAKAADVSRVTDSFSAPNFVAPRNGRLPRVHSIGGVKSDAFTKKASFSLFIETSRFCDCRTPPRTQRVSLLAFTEPTFFTNRS